MKFNLPLNNFTSGEWSPKMQGRTDTEQYQRSCAEITNMFVQMQGGASYRGGTQKATGTIGDLPFIIDAPTNTTDIKTIPYEVPGAKILLTFKRVAGVTSVDMAVIEGTAWTFTVSFDGDILPRNIQHVQVGNYLLLVDTSGTNPVHVFHLHINPASTIYRLFPYHSYLYSIGTTSPTNKAYKRVPWSDMQALDSSVTMTHSGSNAVGATCTITASAPFFSSSDVGAYIRLCSGTNAAGVVRITGYTSTTVVSALVINAVPVVGAYGNTANPTTFWQISAWRGNVWPKTVVAHEQRLIFAGTSDDPVTLWGSRIGNIFHFEEVPEPNTTGTGGFSSGAYLTDNARSFALTVATNTSKEIRTLSTGSTLGIHTDADEIIAYGSNGALGATNATFETATSNGSAYVQPQRVVGYSTFVQRGAVKIRDLVYNDTEAAYKATDLGFVADHFFRNTDGTPDPIIDLAKVQDSSSSYLIVHTTSGKLYYVTLDRDYQINAWGRLFFPDAYSGSYVEESYPYDANRAIVTSIATLDGSLYMTVSRNLAEGTLTFIEKLTEASTTKELSNALDFHTVKESATPTTSFGGIDSVYNNQLVSVIADGAYIGESTVNSGTLTFTRAYSRIVIGFIYPGILKPSPPQVGGQIGTPLGRIKRIDEVTVKFVNTPNAQVGFEGQDLETVAFRKPSDGMGEATPYYTGDKVMNVTSDYSRAPQLVIKQDKPYPMYVASVAARGVTYD